MNYRIAHIKISLVALETIIYKETIRIMRIWVQTVAPPAITMTLYFFIFGKLIGSRVGTMGGHSYVDFIVPGLITMSIITNSYSNVVSSFFGSKFQRNVEEIMVAPVSPAVIVIGYSFGGMMRGFVVGLVVLLVSFAFTSFKIHNIGLLISVSILASLLFSLAGFTNALFSTSFDDVTMIPNFILTPLAYLGGVFYSIDLLGSPWKEISLANPILYIVDAFRHAFIGYSEIPFSYTFAILIFANTFLFSFNYYMIKRGYGLRT